MKKLLLASAIATVSMTATHAAPTIYGKAYVTTDYVDTKDVKNDNSDSLQINSNYSRIGFKGSEAMTESTDVIYQLEYLIDIDNDAGFGFKNRDTYLGLSHDNYGQLRLGHQHSPLQHINNVTVGTGFWDRSFTMMADSRRVKNSAMWHSPEFKSLPVKVYAMYGADESVVGSNDDRNNGYGVSAMYNAGSGFTMGLAYDNDLNINADIGTGVDPITGNPLVAGFYGGDIMRGTLTYDMSKMSGLPLKLGGLYQVSDYDGQDDDEKAFAISATMNLIGFTKPAEVYAQYINTTDYKGYKDVDGDQIVVGGKYKYQPNMIMHVYAGKEDIDKVRDITAIGGGLEYLF